LPPWQSIYLTEDGAVIQQGIPIIEGTHEIPKFEREALIGAIRSDQEGLVVFLNFYMLPGKLKLLSMKWILLLEKLLITAHMGRVIWKNIQLLK
jgi:hypothetical protein